MWLRRGWACQDWVEELDGWVRRPATIGHSIKDRAAL